MLRVPGVGIDVGAIFPDRGEARNMPSRPWLMVNPTVRQCLLQFLDARVARLSGMYPKVLEVRESFKMCQARVAHLSVGQIKRLKVRESFEMFHTSVAHLNAD